MKTKKISYRFKVFGYFTSIVFITVIIVSSVLYFNVKSVIEKETINNNTNTIIQLKNAVDIILKQADMSLMQLAFNSNIESLSERYKKNGYPDVKYDLNSINNLLISNFYFSSAWVYYFDSQTIADVTLIYPSMIDINSNQKYEYKDYIKEVVSLYQNDTSKSIFNLYNIKFQDENMLTLVKPVTPNSKNPKGLLIVNLNASFFDDAMNTIKISEKSDVFIIDKNGQVISKMNKKIPVLLDCMNKQEKGNFLKKKTGWFPTKIDNKEYIVSLDTSELLGWKYIYTIPTSEIYGKIDFIKRCVLLISFLCLFFGIAISLLFTKRLYNPILKIRRNILKSCSEAEHTNNDDIEYINQNLDNLISQNKSLEESLNENIPVLKNSLLTNILKNQMGLKKNTWDKISFYNIQLHTEGYYCVCIISIDQYESLISSYQEKQMSMLEIYQKEIIASLFLNDELLKYEIINFDINQLVLILSINENSHEHILNSIKKIHQEIIKNMKFTVTMGIGSLYDSIDNIYLSYREAFSAQSYKVIKGINKVIHINDVPKYNNWEYLYPYDIEKNIGYYLKQGNEENLMEALNMYFDYSKNNISATTDIKYAFIHLLEITIKTTIELSIDINDFVCDEGNLYKQLLGKETVYEAHEWFNYLYHEIINYINNKRDNKEETIFIKTKEYLDKNFTCPDISLDVLSEKLHFSVSYLGKLYKDAENITIKEYITKKRIEYAKTLLQDTNLKIKEVAEKIGYVTDRSFINMFKKYEGETPGEYKDRYVKKIL